MRCPTKFDCISMSKDKNIKHYFPIIDLLRGVAALSVCIYHFSNHQDKYGRLFSENSLIYQIGNFGDLGVYAFFVISGFVIPLSLYKNQYRISNFFRFISRRSIRIEIPYLGSIFCFLFIAFLFSIKNNSDFELNFEQLVLHFAYLIPFSEYEWYNVIYWTLAIEFQFYILIGFIFPFFKSNSKTLLAIILILFGVISVFFQDNRFVFYYSAIFSVGMTLYFLKTRQIHQTLAWLIIIGNVLLVGYHHSTSIAATCLITLLSINFLHFNNRISNLLGSISYSFYLTHGAVGGTILYLFSRYCENFSQKIGLFLIAIIASMVFSWIFWKLIEHPSQKLAQKIKHRLNQE